MRIEFKTARIKLTLIYISVFLAIVLLSFFVSIETHRSEVARFRIDEEVELLEIRPMRRMENRFEGLEYRFRNRVLLFNLVLLIPSGLFAYWLSGLTLDPIEKTLEQKEAFAGDVSHELRTPLQNIRLEIENIGAQKKPSVSDYNKSLRSIEEESIRIESITESLLSMVRLDKTSVPKETVQIKSLVSSVVKSNQNLSNSKKIKITESYKSNFSLNVVRQQLITAVSIVLENALKYSNVNSRVEITTYIKDSKKALSIKDFGVGIKQDNIHKVFESFYREDNPVTRKVQGSGIGLSLVKKIAEKNGFNVKINSESGKGTEILFIWS